MRQGNWDLRQGRWVKHNCSGSVNNFNHEEMVANVNENEEMITKTKKKKTSHERWFEEYYSHSFETWPGPAGQPELGAGPGLSKK
jgi:hypothetical protein